MEVGCLHMPLTSTSPHTSSIHTLLLWPISIFHRCFCQPCLCEHFLNIYCSTYIHVCSKSSFPPQHPLDAQMGPNPQVQFLPAQFTHPVSYMVSFTPRGRNDKTKNPLGKRLARPFIPLSWSCVVCERVSHGCDHWVAVNNHHPGVLGHFH